MLSYQKFSFQKAQENDKDLIKNLSRICYHDVVIRQFHSWDKNIFETDFEERWKAQNFQIIKNDSDLVGAIWFDQKDDHFYIEEIQIHPNFQNRGIATSLLMQIVSLSQSLKMPAKLQVLKSSEAIKIYNRLGFKTMNETDTHFQMEVLPS